MMMATCWGMTAAAGLREAAGVSGFRMNWAQAVATTRKAKPSMRNAPGMP